MTGQVSVAFALARDRADALSLQEEDMEYLPSRHTSYEESLS